MLTSLAERYPGNNQTFFTHPGLKYTVGVADIAAKKKCGSRT